MTNGQLAAVTSLIARRAAIWTHECLSLRDPFASATDNDIRQVKADVMAALVALESTKEIVR